MTRLAPNYGRYDSPEVRRILEQLEAEPPASLATYGLLRALDERRRQEQREKVAARKARKAAWCAGVGKIMAEVRRREAERGLTAGFIDGNPIDGVRMWA